MIFEGREEGWLQTRKYIKLELATYKIAEQTPPSQEILLCQLGHRYGDFSVTTQSLFHGDVVVYCV